VASVRVLLLVLLELLLLVPVLPLPRRLPRVLPPLLVHEGVLLPWLLPAALVFVRRPAPAPIAPAAAAAAAPAAAPAAALRVIVWVELEPAAAAIGSVGLHEQSLRRACAGCTMQHGQWLVVGG
jgi:hypothetical protein